MRPVQALLASARRGMSGFTTPNDSSHVGSYAVMLVTPIERDKTEPLARVLQAFGTGESSPLAKLPDVHFARWVIIDRLRTDWRGAPSSPSKLESAYLFFDADVTAPAYRRAEQPEAFLRDLVKYMHHEAATVWRHCQGFPGITLSDDEFVSYLTASQIPIELYYVAFPGVTVSQIRQALKIRGNLAKFVRDHQGVATPAELRDDYLRASEAWLG